MRLCLRAQMTSSLALAQPIASDKTTFDWADPLLLEEELGEEERMVRDSARAYCQEKLLPRRPRRRSGSSIPAGTCGGTG